MFSNSMKSCQFYDEQNVIELHFSYFPPLRSFLFLYIDVIKVFLKAVESDILLNVFFFRSVSQK
jgi:hypothetical protein